MFEHVDASLAYSLFYQWVYLVISTLNRLDYLVIVAPLEGQLTVKHAVKDHSSGPNIDPSIYFIILLIEKAFRSHIGKTASIQVFLGEEGDGSRDTKINYFDLLLL